ncbi:MAG: ribosome recycling factor [Microgenomates group bacterium]
MIDFSDTRQKMEEVLKLLREDLLTLRAGRAEPAMVEYIQVEAYETKMPLNQLATITSADAGTLLITPFDKSIIKNILKAIEDHKELGASAILEGDLIRLKFPPLSEERRKELVKLLSQKLEGARIMIRQVRGDKLREIRRKGEEKEINEDEEFRATQQLQKLTDEFNQKIEEMGKAKEKELLTV